MRTVGSRAGNQSVCKLKTGSSSQTSKAPFKRLKHSKHLKVHLKRLKAHLRRLKTFSAFKTFKAFKAFKVI